MRKYLSVPHPFVIEPPAERRMGYKPGDGLVFGLTLLGKAIDYLPYFIYTFDELGNIGIGKGRGKYKLIAVSQKRRSRRRSQAAVPAPRKKTVPGSTHLKRRGLNPSFRRPSPSISSRPTPALRPSWR